MKTKIPKFVWAVLALFALSALLQASTITWSVYITPAGAGSVQWATSSPSASGTLTKSGAIRMNSGAYVDLTFKVNNGYQLTSVRKNTDEVIGWLDGNKHYQFGPVGKAHIIVAIYSVVNPTGDFPLTWPAGMATAVLDVTGHYTGITPASYGSRAYVADMAMDESGKVSGMGTLAGVVPKTGNPATGSVGSLKTVNDTPNAQLGASFAGTVDGKVTTGSGRAAGPLVAQDVGGGNYNLNGVASGAAKVDGTAYSARPTSGAVTVTAAQVSNAHKAWNLVLKFREVVNPTTSKKTVYASAILTLPNGDKTGFKEKVLTFSVRNGYSVRFASGTKLDAIGNPILDPVTSKPVIDRKSSITITRMRIVGVPGHWIVTDGRLAYRFLGQKGKGNPRDFLGGEFTLFTNENGGAVMNGPTAPTTATWAFPYGITRLRTYHWNDGKGTRRPGLLSLKAADGTVYGPYKAVGLPGMGGVKNAYWECYPSVYLGGGTYTIIDSDPTTWSQNAGSGGRGFAQILAKP